MFKCTCGEELHHPTCPLFRGVRGIDNKRRLLGFFAARGHRNLVLRMVDVLEMPIMSQIAVVGLAQQSLGVIEAVDAIKSWVLRKFPSGYIVLPIDKLLEPMELREIEKIQQLISEYRDVRMGKGEPSRREMCPKCAGAGCANCDNTGSITIFLEMSAEEIDMSRGL